MPNQSIISSVVYTESHLEAFSLFFRLAQASFSGLQQVTLSRHDFTLLDEVLGFGALQAKQDNDSFTVELNAANIGILLSAAGHITSLLAIQAIDGDEKAQKEKARLLASVQDKCSQTLASSCINALQNPFAAMRQTFLATT